MKLWSNVPATKRMYGIDRMQIHPMDAVEAMKKNDKETLLILADAYDEQGFLYIPRMLRWYAKNNGRLFVGNSMIHYRSNDRLEGFASRPTFYWNE